MAARQRRLAALVSHVQPSLPADAVAAAAAAAAAEGPAGPLAGITVIDAGQAITGPLAASMLADMGATSHMALPPFHVIVACAEVHAPEILSGGENNRPMAWAQARRSSRLSPQSAI